MERSRGWPLLLVYLILKRYKFMHKLGDKIGIVCCSNGQKQAYVDKIKLLENTLVEIGLQPVFSDCIYERENVFCGTAMERANALMRFYSDDDIKAIFDISGGDVANGILPYLDYKVILDSSKLYWGYSDLTTVINAIYAKTEKPSVLYQIRNLIYDCKDKQIADFTDSILESRNSLFDCDFEFIQGNEMSGVVVGGNIRCFLKLVGTEYMPELDGKILFLESLNGDVAKIETYLCQLQQIGAFEKVTGIILGTFTEMEREQYRPSVEMLIKEKVRDDLPIAVTKDVGHGTNSKAIVIGREMNIKK